MSYANILEVCKKYSACPKFWVDDDIKNIESMKKSFMVQSHEKVIAYLDTSVSSKNEGLVIGEYGIYWRNTAVDHLIYLPWTKLKDLQITTDDWMTTKIGSHVFTGNHYLGLKEINPTLLKKFLTSIQSIVKNNSISNHALHRQCIQFTPSSSLFFFLSPKEKREVKQVFSLRDDWKLFAYLKTIHDEYPYMAFCQDALYIRKNTNQVIAISWNKFKHMNIEVRSSNRLLLGPDIEMNVAGTQLGKCIGVHRLLHEIIKKLNNNPKQKQQGIPKKSLDRKEFPKNIKRKPNGDEKPKVTNNKTNQTNKNGDVTPNKKGLNMVPEVFISHSSKDHQTVKAIGQTLERQGIRCWFAPRDITPGMPWPKEIYNGISQSKIFLLVLSKHSNVSPEVERELQIASVEQKVILPFFIENVTLTDFMKYFVSSIHWMDSFNGPQEEKLTHLATNIKAYLNRLRK